MPQFSGNLTPPPGRFALVAARFNEFVTDKLVAGALDTLRRHGVPDDRIDLAWVPGSFEIPLVARRLAETGNYVAVVCLGCVIRGETDHYEHVATQAASGVAAAAIQTGLPIIFGILTTETTDQALARAGGKAGNKGADAALAAIEMVNLLQQLPHRP